VTSCSHGVLPLTDPPAELLAQAALFLILRDLPPSTPGTISWTQLAGRRFGGDVHAHTLVLKTETGATASVKVSSTPASSALYIDITMQPTNAASGSASTSSVAKFHGVSATLSGPTTLSNACWRPDTRDHCPSGTWRVGIERIHVFCGGHTATVLHRALAWAEALADVRSAVRGALRTPMLSLVVEVRVAISDHMEKGQAVVVLESMKTETALRVPADGIIKAIGCVKGEMVEEGGELVDIEESEEYDQVGVFSTCCILSAKMVYYILVLVSLCRTAEQPNTTRG